jgi:predicted RNase H-like nuclease (RuvC/YqgF family)
MKFIPLRLFKYLYPVDIQKQVNTHFEETLKELTAENSDYHRQIIQLGNQIIQLSGELEATKQELEQSKSAAKQLNANVLHLTEGLNERERQRECLFAKLEAHRDAARVIFAALVKLGHESQQTMSSKKPKG